MNRVREAVEKIEREARRLMPGEPCEDMACQDCEWDRALLAAIHAALLACDEANERAEAAGAEWTKARDAWAGVADFRLREEMGKLRKLRKRKRRPQLKKGRT